LQQVGVTGFCIGGALTNVGSVLVSEVDAAVAFCGVPSAQLADPTKPRLLFRLTLESWIILLAFQML